MILPSWAVGPGFHIARPWRSLMLRLRDLQSGHERFRVMCEADAVDAVSALEFTCCYQRGFVVTGDDLVVD